MPDHTEHAEIQDLLNENQRLLTENNQLLKKLHRATIWGIWFRVVWFLVLIGIPFVLYYYVIEPYFTTLGSSFQTFQEGLQEVPGWKQFYGTLRGGIEPGE